MIKKRLISYFLFSLLQAIGHGMIIYFVIYLLIARENMLVTSFLNIAYIIIGLFLTDKGRNYAISQKSLITEMYKNMGKISKALYAVSQISFRPSMYVFYIVVLIFSQIAFLEPNLIPFNLGNFFQSIEYGILILIAYDNLKVLLIKEYEWFKENVDPEVKDSDE